MAKIIISYRRSDSQAMAGRIFDRLSAHYGEGAEGQQLIDEALAVK